MSEVDAVSVLQRPLVRFRPLAQVRPRRLLNVAARQISLARAARRRNAPLARPGPQLAPVQRQLGIPSAAAGRSDLDWSTATMTWIGGLTPQLAPVEEAPSLRPAADHQVVRSRQPAEPRSPAPAPRKAMVRAKSPIQPAAEAPHGLSAAPTAAEPTSAAPRPSDWVDTGSERWKSMFPPRPSFMDDVRARQVARKQEATRRGPPPSIPSRLPKTRTWEVKAGMPVAPVDQQADLPPDEDTTEETGRAEPRTDYAAPSDSVTAPERVDRATAGPTPVAAPGLAPIADTLPSRSDSQPPAAIPTRPGPASTARAAIDRQTEETRQPESEGAAARLPPSETPVRPRRSRPDRRTPPVDLAAEPAAAPRQSPPTVHPDTQARETPASTARAAPPPSDAPTHETPSSDLQTAKVPPHAPTHETSSSDVQTAKVPPDAPTDETPSGDRRPGAVRPGAAGAPEEPPAPGAQAKTASLAREESGPGRVLVGSRPAPEQQPVQRVIASPGKPSAQVEPPSTPRKVQVRAAAPESAASRPVSRTSRETTKAPTPARRATTITQREPLATTVPDRVAPPVQVMSPVSARETVRETTTARPVRPIGSLSNVPGIPSAVSRTAEPDRFLKDGTLPPQPLAEESATSPRVTPPSPGVKATTAGSAVSRAAAVPRQPDMSIPVARAIARPAVAARPAQPDISLPAVAAKPAGDKARVPTSARVPLDRGKVSMAAMPDQSVTAPTEDTAEPSAVPPPSGTPHPLPMAGHPAQRPETAREKRSRTARQAQVSLKADAPAEALPARVPTRPVETERVTATVPRGISRLAEAAEPSSSAELEAQPGEAGLESSMRTSPEATHPEAIPQAGPAAQPRFVPIIPTTPARRVLVSHSAPAAAGRVARQPLGPAAPGRPGTVLPERAPSSSRISAGPVTQHTALTGETVTPTRRIDHEAGLTELASEGVEARTGTQHPTPHRPRIGPAGEHPLSRQAESIGVPVPMPLHSARRFSAARSEPDSRPGSMGVPATKTSQPTAPVRSERAAVAPVPRQPSSLGFVQLQESEAAEPASSLVDELERELASTETEQPEQKPDLDQMARDVYEVLKQRLLVEREQRWGY